MRAVINSPYVKLLCGSLLIVTSGMDVIQSFGDGTVGAHHGVFVFGIIELLKAIPHLQEGVVEVEEAKGALSDNSEP